MMAGTGLRTFGVLCALSSVMLLLPQPSVAQSQAVVSPAIDNLRQCLVDAGSDARLLALIVVDESGSIRTTDPDVRRTPAVRALLTSVRELAGQQVGGEDVDVEVRITTFAEGYRPLEVEDDGIPVWYPVVEGTIGPLQDRLGVLEDRTEGAWTDYREAFAGARRDLALRSSDLTAETAVAPCKLLVFFTDGMFEPPGGAPALPEARAALCEPGGITDRLRDDGVITVTVGLATGISGPEGEFLAAVSEGSSGAQSCGSTGSPATGLALTADNADDLFFALGSLFPADAELYCPTPDSVSCSFDVPEAFTGFRLLIATPDTDAAIRLTAPWGSHVVLAPQENGEPQLDGVGLRARWPGETNAEIATRDGDGAVFGTWEVQFESGSTPAGTGRVDVYLRADLSLVLEAPSQLTAGSTSEFRVQLARSDGSVVDPSGLGSELTVSIGLPALDRVLEARQDPQGAFVAEIEIPDDLPGNSLLVELGAATSEDDQTQVTIASNRARLPVITPGLATIEPLELRLPGLRGPDRTQGTLTLVGADDADSCVSFRGGDVRLPSLDEGGTAGSGEIEVASDRTSSDCLQVAAGERRDVEVFVDVPVSGLGTARGNLNAVVAAVGSSLQREVTVLVLFDLRPPPDPVRQWTVFTILMLIGIAVPLGVLYLTARRSSMFAPPQLLRMTETDVRWSVADGLRSIREDGELVPDEFEVIDPSGRAERTTSVRLGDVELTRRLGRGPLGVISGLFTGGHGIATARGLPVLAGSPGTGLRRYADEPSHEVPFGLASTWIFVLRRVESDTHDGGFVAPLDDPDGGDVLVGRLWYVVADGPNVLVDGQRLLAQATGEISAAHRDLVASRASSIGHDTAGSTSRSGQYPSSPGDDDLPIT